MFLVNVLVARYSSPELYGQYSLIRSSINLVETTISAALNPLVIKVGSEECNDKARGELYTSIFLSSILCLLLLCLVVFISSSYLSEYVFDSKQELWLDLAVILASLTVLNGILISTFITREYFSKIFHSSFISTVMSGPLAYLLISFYQVEGALAMLILFQIFDLLIKCFFVRRSRHFRSLEGKVKKSLLSFLQLFSKASRLLIVASLLNAIIFWWGRFYLSDQIDGFVQLALFDVAFQFIVIEMLVLNSITTVMLPIFVKRFNSDNRASQLLYLNLIIAFVTSLIMSIAVYLASPYLLSVFGDIYTSNILNLMCIIPLFYSAAIVMNRYMIALGKNIVLLYVSICSAISMFLFIISFVKSATDLVYSFILYYVISCIVYLFVIFVEGINDSKTHQKSL